MKSEVYSEETQLHFVKENGAFDQKFCLLCKLTSCKLTSLIISDTKVTWLKN